MTLNSLATSQRLIICSQLQPLGTSVFLEPSRGQRSTSWALSLLSLSTSPHGLEGSLLPAEGTSQEPEMAQEMGEFLSLVGIMAGTSCPCPQALEELLRL